MELTESRATMEAALLEDQILSPSQHDNIRKRAIDLAEGRVIWESVPFRVLLDVNRRCNLRCVMCDNTHNNRDELTMEVIERLFDEIGWGSMEVQPHASGEPTLAPMHAIAPLARKHNQYFNFITNGILFTRRYFESIADRTARVQFSIHGHTASVSESIAPGQDFSLVIRNLRDAVEIASETEAHVIPSMVLMNQNFEGVVDYIRLMADLGVKRILLSRLFPTSRIYPDEGIELHRSQDEISDTCQAAIETAVECDVFLESNLDEVVQDERNHPRETSQFDILQDNAHIVELFDPDHCISTSITIMVEWDGTVLPCYRDRIVLGNIREQSFDDIWNGEIMQRHRQRFVNQELTEFCGECQAFLCGHA